MWGREAGQAELGAGCAWQEGEVRMLIHLCVEVREQTGLSGFLYRVVGQELCLDTGDMGGRGLRVMRCTTGEGDQRMRMQYHAPGP